MAKALQHSRWIDWQNPRIFWRRMVSTKERRLFCVSFGNMVTLLPESMRLPRQYVLGFALRLLRLVDGVGFLNMLPQTIEIYCPYLVSSDGVPLQARVGIIMQPKRRRADQTEGPNDDTMLKSICLDPQSQERIMDDLAVAALQRTCVTWEFGDIHSNRQKLVNEVVLALNNADTAAFEVRDAVVYEIQATDDELARSALELARIRVAAKHAEQKKELRRVETLGDVDRQRLQAEIDRDKQMLQAQVKKELAQIAEMAQGRRVLFPGQTHELELASIKSQREREARTADEIATLIESAFVGATNEGKRLILERMMQRRFAHELIRSQPLPSPDSASELVEPYLFSVSAPS